MTLRKGQRKAWRQNLALDSRKHTHFKKKYSLDPTPIIECPCHEHDVNERRVTGGVMSNKTGVDGDMRMME